MKQTLIALAVLVVIGLVLLFLFGKASIPGRNDTAGDGVASTSTRSTTTGTVSGAATVTPTSGVEGDGEAAFDYYKG